MTNVSKGHGFEREVKKHFIDAGWGCTRAACSKSPMDLIAYTKKREYAAVVFYDHGYTIKESKSTKIPLRWLATKIEKRCIKHVYYEQLNPIYRSKWRAVLMQCKTSKRR